MAHVSIVGGGIIGLLAARELRAAGCDVTVFDRGEIGREASWAGSGIVSPLHPWRQPQAIHPLSLWSQRAYPDLAAALAAADVCVLLQNHAAYDVQALEREAPRLFDTRGVTMSDKAVRL